MSTKREFVARDRTNEDIARELGADAVFYQDLAEMEDAVRTAGNKQIDFCKACFSGTYPTGDITEQMLADIEADRMTASSCS
jgi:amidophosphoribosyltransferase